MAEKELSNQEQIGLLNNILEGKIIKVTFKYETGQGKGFYGFEVQLPKDTTVEHYTVTVSLSSPIVGNVELLASSFPTTARPNTEEYNRILVDVKALRDVLLIKEKTPEKLLKQIRDERPQVHCITNVITANDCANALLAAGAAATMAHHHMEVADVTMVSNALVLNMGTMECIDAMKIAGLTAKKAGIPIILDPVGAGGAAFRREKTLEIIRIVKPDCIRGNLSELRALSSNQTTTRGVEAAKNEKVDWDLLFDLSKKMDTIVVASGKTNYVVDAKKDCLYYVPGGSKYMPRVTGMGCLSSALLGAFFAMDKSPESARACLEYIADCAKKAEKKTDEMQGGTMTFRMYLIDELSK